MPRNSWTRQETLIALNLYCRTPFGRLHANNPEIQNIATRMGRTPSALAMKCCNLASLDSSLQARGIAGLTKTSLLDRQVWGEFLHDPESIVLEAEQLHAELMQQPLRVADAITWEHIEGTDVETLTKVRVNQHFFRSLVVTGYRSRCAVCGLPFSSLLVASHIVPWSKDRTLRMNPRNGLCLCALHDRAFDKGLLTIDADYLIDIHADIKQAPKTDAIEANFLRFVGQTILLPDRWLPDPELLLRHNALTREVTEQ